jgi:hypothetical protein
MISNLCVSILNSAPVEDGALIDCFASCMIPSACQSQTPRGGSTATVEFRAAGERVFSGDAGGTLRVLSSTSMRLELEGDAHPKRCPPAVTFQLS